MSLSTRILSIIWLFISPLGMHAGAPIEDDRSHGDLFIQRSGKLGTLDDRSFLRRIWLDLAGVLPSPQKAEAFLADTNQDKYNAEIDALLQSEAFTDRWTTFFEDLFQVHHILEFKATYRNAFHENMRSMVAANRGWDEIATSLITGTGAGNDPNANMLFWAKDAFQETQRQDYLDDQAAWISDTMLGVQTLCISCHDGQYHLEEVNTGLSQMTRQEFWGLSAFLSSTYFYSGETIELGEKSKRANIAESRAADLEDTEVTGQVEADDEEGEDGEESEEEGEEGEDTEDDGEGSEDDGEEADPEEDGEGSEDDGEEADSGEDGEGSEDDGEEADPEDDGEGSEDDGEEGDSEDDGEGSEDDGEEADSEDDGEGSENDGEEGDSEDDGEEDDSEEEHCEDDESEEDDGESDDSEDESEEDESEEDDGESNDSEDESEEDESEEDDGESDDSEDESEEDESEEDDGESDDSEEDDGESDDAEEDNESEQEHCEDEEGEDDSESGDGESDDAEDDGESDDTEDDGESDDEGDDEEGEDDEGEEEEEDEGEDDEEDAFFNNLQLIDVENTSIDINNGLTFQLINLDTPETSIANNPDGQYHANTKAGQGMRPPRSGGVIQPAWPFTGETPQPGEPRREALARILTSDRQFARNMVNRIWAHFFGEGFVEPLNSFDLARVDHASADAFGLKVQPRDSQILEELTDSFIANQYDIRALIRQITTSPIYLADYANSPAGANKSQPGGYWTDNKRVRRVEAETIVDSIYAVLGLSPKFIVTGQSGKIYNSAWQLPSTNEPNEEAIFQPDSDDLRVNVEELGYDSEEELFYYLDTTSEIQTYFGRGDYPNGTARNNENNIQNSLFLMNSEILNYWLQDWQMAPNLANLINAYGAGDISQDQVITKLYHDILFRDPNPAERQSVHNHINGLSPEETVTDLTWALINHPDFIHK